MNKKEMLIRFNHAFMAYKDFLYGYPNKELYSHGNIDILLCLFASLTFILNIEELKTKDESNTNYINPNLLDQILNTITTKKEDGYYIEEVFISSNPSEVIKIIRNKIAHGDFTIDIKNKKIIINYNDQIIKIDMDSFIAFVIFIIERIDLYTNSLNYTRNNLYANSNNIKPIRNQNDINQFLSRIYFIEYQFQNMTPYDKAIVEEVLKKIPAFIKSYEEISDHMIDIDAIQSFFAQYNIFVNPQIKNIGSTIFSSTIKKFILENINEVSSLDLTNQISLISNWFYKLNRNQKPKENLIEGIHYNLRLLSELKTKPSLDIQQSLAESQSSGLQSSLIEMIITNDLLGFYVHYHYPLENLCKDKENISDNVYFDCSALNLEFLKPSIFIPPTGQKTSFEQAAQGAKNRLAEINRKLNSATIQQNNLMNKLEEPIGERQRQNIQTALRTIGEQIKILSEKQIQELVSLDILEKNIEEFTITNKESYRYNRSIIEYIRNAIAHGNVYFDYSRSKGSSEYCQIRFLNIYESQELFDLTTSLSDFERLFSYENMQVFNEYLTRLEKGKSK